MTTIESAAGSVGLSSQATARSRAFAVLRIAFGLVWCIDAAYKWVPAFRTQTLVMQFQHHLLNVHTPVEHGWINLWYHVAKDQTTLFGFVIAVIETVIAVCVLTGLCTRFILIFGAIFSLGIWTAAEGAGLPIQAGQTDIGTSIIYAFVYLALFIGAAGTTWSLDARWRSRAGALARFMD